MPLSQIQLIGTVGRDPEMSYTPQGTAVTKLSLAVNRSTKTAAGEKQETTTWYNITAWRGLAETINTHVTKGMQLFVQGELNVRTYTTRDGKNGISLDVTMEKFTFAGGKKANGVTGRGQEGDEGDPLGDLEDHPF